MNYQNLAKNYLFLFLIIFLGFYNFVIAQEEKQAQQVQAENKISIEKITEKIKNFQHEIFSLWEKIHQKIIEIWKQKKLPQIEMWAKKEMSFIKEEFRKEKQEMEQDIKEKFGENFLKIWLWIKSFITK
ncbi:hypothetical protein KKA09_00955 [Patescibacteria group bacterium]|nr:hypothetical protein [Patescibacteria group bacterium]